VALTDDLRLIADAAIRYAEPDEELTGIVPAEPVGGDRAYLCAFRAPSGRLTWLVLDVDGRPIESRARVREVVSIAAMCELAEEIAGGGELDELRSQLVAVQLTEQPDGIDEAEAAVDELQTVIAHEPRIASPTHLDAVGTATRRLERALGDGGSPFATAMQQATATVDELAREVETNYKRTFSY
jgi:hypothetical protein